uniref:Odorant binding protein 8 n=1 Tax=Cyrtorhinus lividipennis TaxID=1032904 RepID=A0A1W6AWH5_9HEMI|nr:odorant binding protein 8 [Cyrtorhinus lividipennis]
MNECVDLVRDKLTNRTGPPPKPEGFDCLEECILSKMGLLGEGKKFDTAKLAATMKDSYSGDWAPIKEVVMKKCEYAIKQTAPCEGYSIESLLKCFLRETYKNCPASLLTASDLCKDNKERMERCPSASPFCPIAGVDD